jgi:toxin ParE1/3/4
MATGRRRAVWSSVALADLDEIWTYYEGVAGRNTAEKIIREIGEAISVIEDHPFAGRSRNELRSGLRSLSVRPHVIFYRVIDDMPEIVRVLDGRRDIDEMFADRD